MSEMSKRPYLSRRQGSKNLYYNKRLVPEDLRAPGRPSQIWHSLETGDELAAKEAYRRIDAETDELFGSWRREQNGELPLAPIVDAAPLTAAFARRVLDRWRVQLIEDDFKRRGALWVVTGPRSVLYICQHRSVAERSSRILSGELQKYSRRRKQGPRLGDEPKVTKIKSEADVRSANPDFAI